MNKQSRNCIYAKNGMCITGNALASAAGIEILQKGGNAIDAAVAMAATLCVIEPAANGLGSDNFALIYSGKTLYGMNSSGRSPKNISKEKILEKHGMVDEMPKYGWSPVTVPGAVAGWVAMNEKFGVLSFEQVLEPAIRYAKEGFPIGKETARMWNCAYHMANKKWNDPQFQGYFETFGYEVKAGDMISLPTIANALTMIAKTKGKSLYKGELAKRIDEESRQHNGFLRKEDLMDHKAEWVDPISVRYQDYDIWEIPPNGQGIVALMALNTLEQLQTSSVHLQIEAIKQAFVNAKHFVSDPKDMRIDPKLLLTPHYGKQCARQIGLDHAKEYGASDPATSGTVYLCAADQKGNMVSMIQSNYMGFGSGIVVDGISLQNRGADFSLDEGHVNYLRPSKKTYHTIIPGFVTKQGQAIAAFGVMGGYMQPQGHVQVLEHWLHEQMDAQSSLDAPRWMWEKDLIVHVEEDMDESVIAELKARGHEVIVDKEYSLFGRGQMIVRLENGVYCGACESRTDSNIGCY